MSDTLPSLEDKLEAHNLTRDEYDVILERLGREPNDNELGLFSVMWSEHCSYKSSRVAPEAGLPTSGPRRACRARARTPASSTSARGWPPSSRSSRTTTRRSSSPIQGAATGVGRDHPRRLHDGRAPDSADELAALRAAETNPKQPLPLSMGRRRHRRATATAWASRRSGARSSSRTATTSTRWSTRSASVHRAQGPHLPRQGRGRGQPGLLRRGQDRQGRHPRRDDGLGRVRRGRRGEAPDRSGRRPVHGEAPARGLPRADGHRRDRRHPGHGRGGPDVLDLRDGRPRRSRASRSS